MKDLVLKLQSFYGKRSKGTGGRVPVSRIIGVSNNQ